MGTKVRILTAVTIDGIPYLPNQVVELPAAVAKIQAAARTVDANAAAVAYCISDLGEKPVVHQVSAQEVPADPPSY